MIINNPTEVIVEPRELAKEADLRYVNDALPGFERIKNGEGFYYNDEKGKRIVNEKILDRIKHLGIPPAWTHVWICPFPNGHIQATGKDEKGRKQYRYHEEWNKKAKEHKFDKLLFFSSVLPEIRQRINTDMKLSGLSKEKVVATVIWILQHTYIRVGNEEYAKENNHFGLTTLRDKHVEIQGDTVTFAFIGKSGIKQSIDISNQRIVKIIRKLDDLPGYELFQYLADGIRHPISSEDVNEYLKQVAGDAISAKDFRTWGGTVLFANTLVEIGPFQTQKEAKKNIVTGVKTVAAYLRNTPTVARNYYIHPAIGESYQEKILIPHFQNIEKQMDKKPSGLGKNEFAVKTLLEDYMTK